MLPRILFLTSNGAGLGHLTRSLAVGRRLGPGLDMVVFTLSQAAPLVRELGVHTEFMFSAGYAGTDRQSWNDLYAHRLATILETYDPAVVSFDGTYPYLGLRRAMAAEPHRTWVWSRRAMWRPQVGERNLDLGAEFDLVVEPGEFAESLDRGPTVSHRATAFRVAPIVFTGRDELLTREEACAQTNLAPTDTNILVQLGAGNINDLASDVAVSVESISAAGGTPVLPISPIADAPVDLPPHVRTISAYPIAHLFHAFDGCIAASGYNAFHELLHLKLPSLFLPNRQTALDDQEARANWAEGAGVALASHTDDPDELRTQIRKLLDPSTRQRLRERCDQLSPDNGAELAAARLREAVAAHIAVGVE